MSIYPVRVSEWFPPGNEKHDIIKYILGPCLHCGKKKLHWQKAWAHHSLPWGYGDSWCNKKHLENYWKKQNK